MSITITEVNLLNKETDENNLMHGCEGFYFTVEDNQTDKFIYDETKFDQSLTTQDQKHYLN